MRNLRFLILRPSLTKLNRSLRIKALVSRKLKSKLDSKLNRRVLCLKSSKMHWKIWIRQMSKLLSKTLKSLRLRRNLTILQWRNWVQNFQRLRMMSKSNWSLKDMLIPKPNLRSTEILSGNSLPTSKNLNVFLLRLNTLLINSRLKMTPSLLKSLNWRPKSQPSSWRFKATKLPLQAFTQS